jgi:hypothetical protein
MAEDNRSPNDDLERPREAGPGEPEPGEPVRPHISSTSPRDSQVAGESLLIRGSAFTGLDDQERGVRFGDLAAEASQSWDAGAIEVTVPIEPDPGGTEIQVWRRDASGQELFSNPFAFAILPRSKPRIDAPVGGHGRPGDVLTLTGTGFGHGPVNGRGAPYEVRFSGAAAPVDSISSWTLTKIELDVPVVPAGEKELTVKVPWEESAPVKFTVGPRPKIVTVTAKPEGRILPDKAITIAGSDFGWRRGKVVLRSDGQEVPIEVLEWSPKTIIARVPGLARIDWRLVKTLIVRVPWGDGQTSEGEKEFKVDPRSSVTTWMRLEAHARTKDLQDGLRRGLEARVYDASWLLARQWQFREFDGEDAGSPVRVELAGEVARLSRWQPQPGAEPPPPGMPRDIPLDRGVMPLETLVERERASAPPTAGWDIRFAVEAGLHFLRLLAARLKTDQHLEEYRRAYVALHPFEAPGQPNTLDADSLRFVQLAHRRAPDGRKLFADLERSLPSLPDLPKIKKRDEEEVLKAAEEWVAWTESFVTRTPAASGAGAVDSWNPQRMEYAFAASAKTTQGEVVLAASEYTDGDLDWHAFSIGTGSLGATSPPTSLERAVLPSPASYPGMPATRWSQFEDGQVDFGGLDASPADLARLVFIEFATVYGNNWLVVPVAEVDVGSLVRNLSVRVANSFGDDPIEVEPFSAGEDARGWRMFQLSGAAADSDLFFLAPALPASLHSDPIEDVLLLRDETANMAWGVERVVESKTGRPLNRFEAYRAQADGPGTQASSAALTYRLVTSVPDYWIPFVPAEGGRRRARAAMPREGGGTFEPNGVLLERGKPLNLYDEEVPRAGAQVTRAYQYARWVDGSTHLWVGRRKRPGRGEGSSGLRFDDLKEGFDSTA